VSVCGAHCTEVGVRVGVRVGVTVRVTVGIVQADCDEKAVPRRDRVVVGRRAFVAALALLGTASSCADGPGASETIAEATVRVRADGCGPRTELGVGTSIGDGLVVTAAHVVAGSDHVEVVGGFGAPVGADVVFFDPALDVAALRPAAPVGRPAPIRGERADEGDIGLIAIASDDGSIELVEVEVVQQVTILTTDIYRDASVERPGLRVAVDVSPGDSGAMVHLTGGGVGIVWSRSTESTDRAWTVDVPTELLDATSRRSLRSPVDTGACLDP